jgi:GTP-binding protein YchF
MRVALVGPPLSGKSTLFAAVAEAGGSHVHLDRPDTEHLAVVKVPDERLEWLFELYKPKKCVHAELEFLDVPGLDLTDEPARQRARQHWPAVRQSDMLALVLRGFRDDAIPAYQDRLDPPGDLEELTAEMLFSDLEQVAGRTEKLRAALKKPTGDREAHQRELALMERMQQALESERPLAEVVANEAEEKMVRAFAFLTLKPLLVVVNCDEDAAGGGGPETIGGYPAIQLSAKIEEEIASLPPGERGEFLEAMGIKTPAADRLIRSCYDAMRVVSFFTHGDKEARAWTVPAGTEAVAAAGEVHTDMARGFIRAEVIGFEDLKAAGDEKGARAAGKYRLEGKSYVVQDGDVIHFRFNV